MTSFVAIVLLTSCNGQTTQQVVKSDPIVQGDTVTEPGNSIMLVYQDQKNNYWFGSWETGVYKFDGKTFIQYTTKHGLPSNRIDEIREDKLGNIYLNCFSQQPTIVKFDGHSFTKLKATPSNEWKLQSDDIWFRHSYQYENKVYRYDGITLYELELSNPPNLPNAFGVYSIYKDRKENIWFGTNPVGVCRYDGKSFEWITEEDVTEFRNEGANGVRSVLEDKKGDFWFNTEFRYGIYDSTTLNSKEFYTRHESIGGLDGKKNSNLDEYLSCVKDNEDNLWFVTYLDGVWKYDGIQITHFPVQDNSKNISLFSIYMDNNGQLWLGTHENGVYKFNGKSFEKLIKEG